MDFTPEEIAQFKKRRQMELAQFRTSQPQTTTTKKGGRGGFLTSLISEGAGTGGAMGGAALGASVGSVVPGIGTLIGGGLGGLIGGFAGGFGGRAVENKVRDDEYRLEDALGEGIMSGVLGGAGGAFRAAKGAKALASVDDVAKAGKLSRGATGLKTSVINPKTQASVFGAADDAKIVQTVDKYVKGLNSGAKYKNLEPAMRGLSDDIAKTLKPITKTTPTKSFVTKLSKSIADDVNFVPTDKAYINELNRVTSKLSSFGKNGKMSPQAIFDGKQWLGTQLKGAFGKSGADLTVPQQVRMAVWGQLDDNITKLAPQVKDLTMAQSYLMQSAKGLQQAANKTVGIPLLGLKSKSMSNAIQTGQYGAAKALDGASKGVSGLSDALMGASGSVPARMIPGMAGRGALNQADAQSKNTPMIDPIMNTTMDTTSMPANTSNIPTLYNESQAPSSTGITKDQILQAMLIDISTTGGENLAQIKAIYEFMQPEESATQKPMTQGAINSISEFDNSLANLDEVESLLDQGGGAFNPIGGRLKSLNPFDETAANINQATLIAAQNIGRALEGGKLTDADIARYRAALPNINDTPQIARDKINRLRFLISNQRDNFLSLQAQGGASSSEGDLEDQLFRLQQNQSMQQAY